jgi:hypothetical protein
LPIREIKENKREREGKKDKRYRRGHHYTWTTKLS